MRIPFFRSRAIAAVIATPKQSSPADAVECPAADAERTEWRRLAATQRRTYAALRAEIEGTSAFVETSVVALTDNFTRLADTAGEQRHRVERIIGIADTIEVGAERLALSEVTRLLDEALRGTIAKILDISNRAASMATVLEGVRIRLGRVEQCVGRIDEINDTTNLLALTAMSEAARGGDHGEPFTAFAGELQELACATNGLAGTMRTEVGGILDGLRDGDAILREVADIDVTGQKLTQQRLGLLLQGLLKRREEVEALVEDASSAAVAVERDIGRIIVGIQFQDRSKQRLDHVVDALAILDQAVRDRLDCTADGGDADVDDEWLKSLIARCTMADVRKRFAAQLLSGRPIDDDGAGDTQAHASEGGDIELF